MSDVSRKDLFKNLFFKTADIIQKPADKLNTFVEGYSAEEENSEADITLHKRKKVKYMAWLDTEKCMAYQGIVCMSCLGHCPKTRQGLKMMNSLPVIDAIKCNGCARCVERCSAYPSAIELIKRPVAEAAF